MKRFEQFNIRRNIFGAFANVIGGFLGSASQAATNATNARINRENNRFNHDEAILAYQRQRQLIDDQRAYEGEVRDYYSEVNQRKRFEEAGLNPYMMMNGGSAGTIGAGSSPSAPPSASASSPIPMQAQRYEWLQNMAMQSAQIDVLKSQANKNNSDASLSDANKGIAEVQKRISEINEQYQQFSLDFHKRFDELLVKMELNRGDSEAAKNDAERGFIRTQELDFLRMTPYRAAKSVADIFESVSRRISNEWNVKERQSLLPFIFKEYVINAAYTASLTWLNNQEANFNNATFNARRDAVNYNSFLLGQQAKSAKFQAGIDAMNYNVERLGYWGRLNRANVLGNTENFIIWLQQYNAAIRRMPGVEGGKDYWFWKNEAIDWIGSVFSGASAGNQAMQMIHGYQTNYPGPRPQIGFSASPSHTRGSYRNPFVPFIRGKK